MGDYDPINKSVEVDNSVEVGGADDAAEAGGDGCCRGAKQAMKLKEVEMEYQDGPLSDKHDHTRDLPCLCFFVLWWVGAFAVFGLAYTLGDGRRLTHPSDYEQNICGVVNEGSPWPMLVNRSYVTYPRLSDDIRTAVDTCQGEIDDCMVSLYSVCVESCPMQGDIVCNYVSEALYDADDNPAEKKKLAAQNREGCWFTPIDTTEKMGRCIPIPKTDTAERWYCMEQGSIVFGDPAVTTRPLNDWDERTATCTSEAGNPIPAAATETDCQSQANRPQVVVPECAQGKSCTQADCKGKIVDKTTVKQVGAAGSDALFGTLLQYAMVLQEYFKGVADTYKYILLFGAGLSVAASVVYIILLKLCACIIVWGVMIGMGLLLFALDCFLFVRSGTVFGYDLGNVTTEVNKIILEHSHPEGCIPAVGAGAVSGTGGSGDGCGGAHSASTDYTSPEDNMLFFYGSYALLFLVVVYTMIIICKRRVIWLLIKIVQNSSDFLAGESLRNRHFAVTRHCILWCFLSVLAHDCTNCLL